MKWFKNIHTIEELRKEYRQLLKKYHPDNDGGNVEVTQEINAEYDALFARLSYENDTGDKEYDYEENEQFKAILCEILSTLFSCSVNTISGTKESEKNSDFRNRKNLSDE